MGSQHIPEILSSIGCSQRFSVRESFVCFCFSDKLILQCWSLFCFFKHWKAQSVFDKLLVSKPGCWPIKKWWIFFLIPLPAYIVMSTLRDMLQPVILLILFCFLMGSHQSLPHSHSSLGLLKLSCNTHSRGTLFATRSSAFTTQQPRSAATLWLLVCYFCGNRT